MKEKKMIDDAEINVGMTDEEIIKALEYCGSNHKENSCEICPLRHVLNCFDTVLHDNALDLIHRQKAEIERLNKCVMSEEQIRKCCADIIQGTMNKAEKETAREILQMYRLEDTFSSFQEKVMKRYGVEVE